jgi:hypothetical protein
MSKGTVNQVIQRAIGDAAFRRQLQSDPKKALAGFDLTADERSAITSGDPGKLTALGVDQRMSKAFNLSGISAASASAVSPDLSAASAKALIDEGGAAGRATSAIETGGASANTANLRRIEGDLNVSAAREAEDVSGDFNRFDPGIVTNATSAAREGAQSANAMNLRRIEGDLNVGSATTGGTSALNTGGSAYEGTDTKTSEATAFEPADVSGDFNQLDPGIVSGEDTAARDADVAKDAGSHGLRPNEPTE